MSESGSTPAFKSAGSFASLLESFTGPVKKPNEMWDDTALLDDVATISYEQALRSHRRVPPVEALLEDESPPVTAPTASQALPVARGNKRKSASITIRLTEAEEAQLHERAAAAQLSVSAYLRSCIFEAEALRTQVKQALAQMQAPPPISTSAAQADEPPRKWHARFLSRFSHHSKAGSDRLKADS
jgi:hypothetical protein